MWSDNDTSIDFIDYKHLVDGVEAIVKNDDLTPCTIGLYGDWGSGKSSLLRMIESRLDQDNNILTIKFNGWLFEGYEDAKVVLMSTILEEIISKRTFTAEAKKLAIKLFKRIDKMKMLKLGLKGGMAFATMGPAGVAALGATEIYKGLAETDYEGLFREDEEKDESATMGIRQFHLEFEQLLQDTKIKRLVVCIDDLDRCLPDTIIATLEAIKLFLFTKNSAFIICADERIIEYAVRKRFPEIPGGERLDVGRDYLEKLIQFPIRIPHMSASELETYVNLLFSKLYIRDEQKFQKLRDTVLANKATSIFGSSYNFDVAQKILTNVPVELNHALVLSQQITPVLAANLHGNPRQSKRFLNMLLMRAAMAKSKEVAIDNRILAKLMLLEYFRKESFTKLYALQVTQDGVPNEIKTLEIACLTPDQTSQDPELSAEPDISPELELWVKDPWLHSWLKSEPKLSSIDLRSYFYFSRDQLSASIIVSRRMSSLAQTILGKLMHSSEAIQRQAISDSGQLNAGDASAIFDSLTQKIKQEGDKVYREALVTTLFGYIESRKELTSQLLEFLASMAPENLTPTAIPQLLKAIKGSPFEKTGSSILKKWSENTTNTSLAKIAKSRITKIN
ncbi:KAP family P-loop NTPase fold protein [Adhaeribacter soli]|uniref:KAP NTPase domain-containing protein n=1 Tax=Adhaeribacter soli TaxID=2607655 RepID=A0A5N1J2X3_9BACT|nr:P-loop NTPase fold protein [Adhaeribacter soli]KAA9340116.1 hypothetical protein F0P94_07145 [Adhaeribacter soli]